MNPNFKSKLLQVFYSLLLIPLWGLGLLQIDIANDFTRLLTFLFTAYIILFLKYKQMINKGVLLIGPTFYMVATIIIRPIDELILFPITWIYFMFIILLLFGELKLLRSHIFILFIIIAFIFKDELKEEEPSFLNFSKEYDYIRKPDLLLEYEFINYLKDTVHIDTQRKPVLIETWNETCKPCIASIKEMEDDLGSYNSFHHIYLYQSNSSKSLALDSILNYKHITDKSKIYVDANNRLLKSMGLKSYPFFIIFNSEGEMKKYFSGYKSEYKNEILNKLLNEIAKSK
ncbi:hypothetical protein QYS48_29010 [Marivirga arenosa]|uniref:Thioredoxin domain-containing protein n=1 Tax=Marivirga arenosa TaxID=3059076 RepID=A0AA51N765_9BACT|nr:hypothetical protein [Marivirga sp. ABR2-2]WMN07512.1 hypothetical protein QYS48_29010 [Marivirga sp. ABR2-2]